jgi:hypothetical protein
MYIKHYILYIICYMYIKYIVCIYICVCVITYIVLNIYIYITYYILSIYLQAISQPCLTPHGYRQGSLRARLVSAQRPGGLRPPHFAHVAPGSSMPIVHGNPSSLTYMKMGCHFYSMAIYVNP